jgi:hypothetical protein
MTLSDQARHVLQLVEAVRDDDLDGLCTALEAAEMLVTDLERRIRLLVAAQDHAAAEMMAGCRRRNPERIC